jgi:hypothetical protein
LMIPSNSSTANGTEGHKCSSHPSVQHELLGQYPSTHAIN